MVELAYTVFEYTYRDAGNYKVHGQCLLVGACDAEAVASIRKCCEAWEQSVAEQVGMPSLREELFYYSGGPTEADVPVHEFGQLRPATLDDVAYLCVWGTLDALVARFREVKFWDYALAYVTV